MAERPAAAIVALLFVAACAEEPDEPEEAHIDTLHVRVVDYLRDDAPMPNVPCAFTKPGGERVEVVTDGVGQMVVSDLDWSLGTLSLVCLTTDAYALLELGEDDIFDGYIRMFATTDPPAETNTIRVSGTVTQRATTDSRIVVQSSHGLGWSDSLGNTFEVPVLANEPFDLFAYERGAFVAGARQSSRELFGWTLREGVIATSNDVTVDLDFASKPEVVTSNGHLGLPANTNSVFYGASANGDTLVLRRDNLDILVGLARSTDHTGPTFDCQVESLGVLASPEDVYTRYSIFADTSEDSPRTSVMLEGLPKNSTSIQFLDAPTVVAPTETVPYAGAEVTWSADGEPPTALHVCDADGRCLYAYWPSDLTSIRLPELPGQLWKPGEDVHGFVLVQEGRTEDDQYFRRYAHGRVLTLTQ